MSHGDKWVVKGASGRYLSAASLLCYQYKEQIEELEVGANYSILDSNIVELSKIPGIGDVKLNKLIIAGINSVQKFISTGNKKLSEVLGNSEKQVMKFKKNCVVFL
jgi:replicative superfamily II helicase